MTRVFARTTADKLILTQTRASQVVDAIANLVIAILTLLFALPGMIFFWGGTIIGLAIGSLFWIPLVWFVSLGINCIIRIFFPCSLIIDRITDSIVLNGSLIGQIKDLREIKIVFTGYYSPSRNTLRATMADGRTYSIEETGYFGSRLELRQLCDLIAEFTQRFDLYVR